MTQASMPSRPSPRERMYQPEFQPILGGPSTLIPPTTVKSGFRLTFTKRLLLLLFGFLFVVQFLLTIVILARM